MKVLYWKWQPNNAKTNYPCLFCMITWIVCRIVVIFRHDLQLYRYMTGIRWQMDAEEHEVKGCILDKSFNYMAVITTFHTHFYSCITIGNMKPCIIIIHHWMLTTLSTSVFNTILAVLLSYTTKHSCILKCISWNANLSDGAQACITITN